MAKLKHVGLFVLLMLFAFKNGFAQQLYAVTYSFADSATTAKNLPPLTSSFLSLSEAQTYLSALPQNLQLKGFIAASVDEVVFDSLSAHAVLYIGQQYRWARLQTAEKDGEILSAVRWNTKELENSPVQFSVIWARQQQIAAYLEETGYPFSKIYLDSIKVSGAEVEAQLAIYRGPLYKIDSIRVYGDAKVSNLFLQRYLNITNGSLYNKKKLAAVSKKLSELTYLKEEKQSDVTLLATGSVLNLYLKTVRNSQVNALVGFLPNAEGEKGFRVSGEANILLRNALSSGETIGVNAQWLQKGSPRLNLLYAQPFLFRSPVGLRFNFDMFKKDSTFLNINLRLGATYGAGQTQSGTVFIEKSQTLVNGINAAQVLTTRQLPPEADVSATLLGFIYDFNATDYKLNPQKGSEVSMTLSAGTKKLKKNNAVLELTDPAAPEFKYERLYDTVKLKTYQVRITTALAHYFKTGKQTTLKTALQAGLFNSGNVFRNEAFRIGGYRLLRGFDEESQYVTQYAVGTLEYRILLQRNSALFAFADGGLARLIEKQTNRYLGTGLGISSETAAGIFNLVWAVGTQNNSPFNLRQSKVHLGFVNYF